jgi:hypothetical protein
MYDVYFHVTPITRCRPGFSISLKHIRGRPAAAFHEVFSGDLRLVYLITVYYI